MSDTASLGDADVDLRTSRKIRGSGISLKPFFFEAMAERTSNQLEVDQVTSYSELCCFLVSLQQVIDNV